jgi:hypothetical protein
MCATRRVESTIKTKDLLKALRGALGDAPVSLVPCSQEVSQMLIGAMFLRPSLAPSGGAASRMPGQMFTLVVALCKLDR